MKFKHFDSLFRAFDRAFEILKMSVLSHVIILNRVKWGYLGKWSNLEKF